MSNNTSKPQTKSTIHENLLSHKKYDDPLKKQPTSFKGSIDEIMKKKVNPDEDPTMDTKPKKNYKGSIYDMIKKHPPVKRPPQKVEEAKDTQKPVFKEDLPKQVPPPVIIPTKAPIAPKSTAQPHKAETVQPKKEYVDSQRTGIVPGSSVGSVARTLSLFG